MSKLTDKKVLLFAPRFFGYENEIANNIQRKASSCFFYDERAKPTTLEKILIRLNFRNVLLKKINSYYQNIIDKYPEGFFDFVIFLNPETITVELLQKLKEKQNKATFVLYMWDSFENKPHTKELLPYFDNKLSFNKQDCNDFGMSFRPLFYIDKYDSDKMDKNSCTYEYDIGFIGTIHSDRYKILKEVEEWAESEGLKTNYFMFFPSKVLYYKYKIENLGKQKVDKKDFHYDSLNSNQVFDFLSKCNTVIDIQHPKQVGLTMRTIEMLGLRKKLITTNKDIVNYDFYNKENIYILDRNNTSLNKEFFNSNYNTCTDVVRDNYSINAFTDALLYWD